MAMKSVLVAYSERNKVFRIPKSIEFPDVIYLEKEFKKEFKFQPNINLEISFQRFEKDWDEFVEVDKDCTMNDKEKLKAVVTPLLVTDVSSQSEVCQIIIIIVKKFLQLLSSISPKQIDEDVPIASVSGTHVSTEIVGNSSDYNNDEQDENDCDSYDHFTTPEQSTSPVNVDVDCPSTPKRKRRKLIKSEDDLIPLPNPFPLPKHF